METDEGGINSVKGTSQVKKKLKLARRDKQYDNDAS